MKTRLFAALLAASAFGLTGCVTDDYGYGGGVSLGYGTGYGGGGYYGDPYWGWYDDYYYPGTGYYIYDRGGARHRWNDRQRAYWEGRRGNRPGRNDWSGFRRDGNAGNPAWQQRREAWRAQNQGLSPEQRQQRREAWRSQGGSGQGLSGEARQQRREAWQAQRQQRQQMGGQPSGQGWQGRQRQQQSPSPAPSAPRSQTLYLDGRSE